MWGRTGVIGGRLRTRSRRCCGTCREAAPARQRDRVQPRQPTPQRAAQHPAGVAVYPLWLVAECLRVCTQTSAPPTPPQDHNTSKQPVRFRDLQPLRLPAAAGRPYTCRRPSSFEATAAVVREYVGEKLHTNSETS